MWNSTPVREVQFGYNPDTEAYSLARSQLLSPNRGYGMSVTTQQPGLGGQVAGAAAGLGSRVAGGMASMGTRSALTPQPRVPTPNPYEMWGNNYLSRYNA